MKRAILVLTTLAGTAWAQDRPLTAPTRDVDVTYRASLADGRSLDQRSRFAVEAGLSRIDGPTPGVYMIIDRKARRMDMVSDGDRLVVGMSYGPDAMAQGIPPGQAFTRAGSAVVADTPCTDWRTADRAGHELTVCITADGVLLRLRAGAAILLEAERVRYGPIDPAAFGIPPGYAHRSARDAR